MLITPGAVGGGSVVISLDCTVTFCRAPFTVQSKPFFFAYWQPLFKLLVAVTEAQSVTGSQSTCDAPVPLEAQVKPAIVPPPPRIRTTASCTAPSAVASAAAWACFSTKNDQPRSTARPMRPAIANSASV